MGGRGVARDPERFIIILLILAAGLVTAIFIFCHPTPIRFQQATTDEPVRFPRDETARFDAQAEWWYYTGFVEMTGYAE